MIEERDIIFIQVIIALCLYVLGLVYACLLSSISASLRVLVKRGEKA